MVNPHAHQPIPNDRTRLYRYLCGWAPGLGKTPFSTRRNIGVALVTVVGGGVIGVLLSMSPLSRVVFMLCVVSVLPCLFVLSLLSGLPVLSLLPAVRIVGGVSGAMCGARCKCCTCCTWCACCTCCTCCTCRVCCTRCTCCALVGQTRAQHTHTHRSSDTRPNRPTNNTTIPTRAQANL